MSGPSTCLTVRVDGLKEFPEAIESVYPQVQSCTVDTGLGQDYQEPQFLSNGAG
jgi:hypothetical protein